MAAKKKSATKTMKKRAAAPKKKSASKTTAVVATKKKKTTAQRSALPKDDASWQVLADDLQSKGDPRGEVLAIQKALEKNPKDAALRKAEREALRALLTGKLSDYLARFEAMANGLKKDSSKLFLGWFAMPPTPEREIAEVEAALGYVLDDSIKTFYRQTNGLQLFAIDRDAENFNSALHKTLRAPAGPNDYRLTESPGPTHSINILPLRKAFLSDYNEQLYFDWMNDSDTTSFGKKSYPQLSFAKSLRPFDLMTDFYQMGFILFDKVSNPPVTLANDYGASWNDAKVTTFESYLESLITLQGSIDKRNRHYSRY